MTVAGIHGEAGRGSVLEAPGLDAPALLDIVARLIASRQRHEGHIPTFPLNHGELSLLCKAASRSFDEQPGLLRLQPGLIVVGDIHGQFDDMLRVFDTHGHPPKTRYLFLGDYVDRGPDGLEVVCLLLAYRLLYPDHINLIRGNHECCTLTLMYGFYAECIRKLGMEAWREVTDTFNYLPLAALIGNKIFCVHGGISPRLEALEQINEIQRPVMIQHEVAGLLTDLVWSDPAPYVKGWQKNPRGAGYFFGVNTVRAFKQRFGLSMVVRSHEAQKKGYSVLGRSDLVTVFSAPNYRSTGNTGATMVVSHDCTFRFRMFQPLDEDGQPLIAQQPSSDDWAIAAAPAALSQPAQPSGADAAAHRPAFISPFAAASGTLEAMDVTVPEPSGEEPAVIPPNPATAMSSPFSGLQYAAFEEEDDKPAAARGVMPSPFAVAQSGSSGEDLPVGETPPPACSGRASWSSHASSSTSYLSAQSSRYGSGISRVVSGDCPRVASAGADTATPMRPPPPPVYAPVPSPFASASQGAPPISASPNACAQLSSPFAPSSSQPPTPYESCNLQFSRLLSAGGNMAWALRQDSLALHNGAPAHTYSMELRSSFSLSPPIARRPSCALPPVTEVQEPPQRAPPADAKRLAWRAANPAAPRNPPSGRLIAEALVHQLSGALSGSSSGSDAGPQFPPWRLPVIERVLSIASEASPRSPLSTLNSISSSSTSTSGESFDSDPHFLRRASSVLSKGPMRQGRPFFERSLSAGSYVFPGAGKGRAPSADRLLALARRKRVADGLMGRLSSDPVGLVPCCVGALQAS